MEDHAVDRQEIIDLTIAYCRIVDSGDFDALRNLFTNNATAELGGSGQTGIDQICERLSFALAPYLRWEHFVDQHEVHIEDDTATARCVVHAIHVRAPGKFPVDYIVDGTYDDRLARTVDGWRITHRSLVRNEA